MCDPSTVLAGGGSDIVWLCARARHSSAHEAKFLFAVFAEDCLRCIRTYSCVTVCDCETFCERAGPRDSLALKVVSTSILGEEMGFIQQRKLHEKEINWKRQLSICDATLLDRLLFIVICNRT